MSAARKRELRHVAAEDVLEPPAVLLLAGPGADLLVGQVLQGHRILLGCRLNARRAAGRWKIRPARDRTQDGPRVAVARTRGVDGRGANGRRERRGGERLDVIAGV